MIGWFLRSSHKNVGVFVMNDIYIKSSRNNGLLKGQRNVSRCVAFSAFLKRAPILMAFSSSLGNVDQLNGWVFHSSLFTRRKNPIINVKTLSWIKIAGDTIGYFGQFLGVFLFSSLCDKVGGAFQEQSSDSPVQNLTGYCITSPLWISSIVNCTWLRKHPVGERRARAGQKICARHVLVNSWKCTGPRVCF